MARHQGVGMNQGPGSGRASPGSDPPAPPGWSSMVFGPVRQDHPARWALGDSAHPIDMADLSAHPRSAKRGSVTTEIEVSLATRRPIVPGEDEGDTFGVIDPRSRCSIVNAIQPDFRGHGAQRAFLTAVTMRWQSGRHVLREAGLDQRRPKRKSLIGVKLVFSVEGKSPSDRLDIEDVLEFPCADRNSGSSAYAGPRRRR